MVQSAMAVQGPELEWILSNLHQPGVRLLNEGSISLLDNLHSRDSGGSRIRAIEVSRSEVE